MMGLMNLLSMEQISKTLKDSPLFEGVSLGIDLHERIGLIGANGSGKTTFLNLVTGRLEPDTGSISRNRELRISMLEQDPQFSSEMTVRDVLCQGTSDLSILLRRYRRCLENPGSEAELHYLTEQMEKHHGWEAENTYASLVSELGINALDIPIHELSGGMRKKAALASALALQPNLLILDEPTNHLDIPTVQWLENYIISSNLGCIVVTHDRYFLDAACTKIFEIDRASIFSYEGNYSTFVEKRQQRNEIEQAGQQKIASVLRDELKWLRRGPRARTGKDKGRKQRLENLMDARIRKSHDMAEFSSGYRRLGKKVLELSSVKKSYDGTTVIEPFSYSFKQGERIGLIGPNGSGKTTFLDIISGHIGMDSGTADWGANTRLAYFDQLNRPFNEEMTVLECITRDREQLLLPEGGTVSASRFLEQFGFDASFHRIPVSRLSGGERRRLYLLSILAQQPNFLMLDEPTNDLDIPTLARLEAYLNSFQGCALIVSHDRAFLDSTVDYLFIFDGSGNIQGFPGRCSDFFLEFGFSSREKKNGSSASASQSGNRRRKLSFKEQREFDSLLEVIEQLEAEKHALEQEFLKPDDAIEEKSRRYQEVLSLIEESSQRWEYLAEIDENS